MYPVLNEWLVTVSVSTDVEVEFTRISPLRNWGTIGEAIALGTIKLHSGNKYKRALIELPAR